MPVIYLDKHRHLTKEQKKMAEVALSNEINDVMANLEIMEEEMDRTSVFGELNLREVALKYLGQKEWPMRTTDALSGHRPTRRQATAISHSSNATTHGGL